MKNWRLRMTRTADALAAINGPVPGGPGKLWARRGVAWWTLACLLSLWLPAAGDPALALRSRWTGFLSPVQVTHAGDGSGRLFVVERAGRIRLISAVVPWQPVEKDTASAGTCCGSPPTAGSQRVPGTATFSAGC